MHNKSLANNPQKLPTVSLILRTFKYFSISRNFYCKTSVLAEEPFPVLPLKEMPTFLLNRRWWNLNGNLPSWAGKPDFVSRQIEGRWPTLWERSSIETANGNDLCCGRGAKLGSEEMRPFPPQNHLLHNLNIYTVLMCFLLTSAWGNKVAGNTKESDKGPVSNYTCTAVPKARLGCTNTAERKVSLAEEFFLLPFPKHLFSLPTPFSWLFCPVSIPYSNFKKVLTVCHQSCHYFLRNQVESTAWAWMLRILQHIMELAIPCFPSCPHSAASDWM